MRAKFRLAPWKLYAVCTSHLVMKIIHHAPQKLTIGIRPGFAWLVGGFFLTAGTLPTFFSSQQTLTCDRTPPATCELTTKTIWWTSRRSIPINDIQTAILDTSYDSDGNDTYRVVLQTPQNPILLTSYYTPGYTYHQNRVNQINTFLETSDQPSLYLRNDDRLLGLVSLVLVGGPGFLVFLFFGQIIICDLDRQSGKLSLIQKKLTGTTCTQQDLNAITDTSIDRHRGNKGGWCYQVNFILKSGKTIALTPYYSSGRADKEKTVALIRQFLGLSAES